MIDYKAVVAELVNQIEKDLREKMRPIADKIVAEACAKYAVELSKEVSFDYGPEKLVITLRIKS